jgi:hypothetical protein
VIGGLVNLTGGPQRAALRMAVPEVPGAEFTFRVVVRTMSQEDAGATLDRIAQGAIARCILSWIPLMAGGGEDGIIKRWKRLAEQEANTQFRSDYAALALVFAELSRCAEAWKRGLEGWNMIQSKQILEWENAGGIKHTRKHLLRVLEVRFPGALPRRFVQRVEAIEDVEELERWFDAALTAEDWEAFTKTLDGAV